MKIDIYVDGGETPTVCEFDTMPRIGETIIGHFAKSKVFLMVKDIKYEVRFYDFRQTFINNKVNIFCTKIDIDNQ